MNYYGSVISENMLMTKDGFLICRNVPISRTGAQDYIDYEIYGIGEGKIIKVMREENEVFSDEAIASFEGLPFADDHPNGNITPDNFTELTKGHVQNVRRGKGKFENNLVADIFVNDKDTIEKIQLGKREISCGYSAEEIERDGVLYQTKIRGNHVALVDKGRAGSKVAIRDNKTCKGDDDMTNEAQKENVVNNNDSVLSKVLDYFMNKDAKPVVDKKDEGEEKKEEKSFVSKEEFDKLKDAFEALMKGKEEKKEEPKKEDACGSCEEKDKEKKDGEVVVSAEDKAPTISDVLNAVNPCIAKITDEALKSEFVDVISKFMDRGENPIAKAEQVMKDSAVVVKDNSAEIQNYYDQRNPHLNKGGNQ